MSASQAGASGYFYHGEMWGLPSHEQIEATVQTEAWEEADTRLYAAIDRVMRLQQDLRESHEQIKETLERLIRLLSD